MAKPHDHVIDPFDYLHKDHEHVAGLFERLLDTTERAHKTRTELFDELYRDLGLHAELEEDVVYPVLEQFDDTHTGTLEAIAEHHIVKLLLNELSLMEVASEEWRAKMITLEENVTHHVHEEEKELFPRARRELSEEEIKGLAALMQTFLATNFVNRVFTVPAS
jgi:hemerythrin superfamily protein